MVSWAYSSLRGSVLMCDGRPSLRPAEAEWYASLMDGQQVDVRVWLVLRFSTELSRISLLHFLSWRSQGGMHLCERYGALGYFMQVSQINVMVGCKRRSRLRLRQWRVGVDSKLREPNGNVSTLITSCDRLTRLLRDN